MLQKIKIAKRLLNPKWLLLACFLIVFAFAGVHLTRGTRAASQYEVVGNVIRDPNNAIFVPHGVDRPSLEWGCTGKLADASGPGLPASDFSTMKSAWGANTVRIALNQDFWLSGSARYCSTYQDTVKAAVSAARQAGLVVILDLHWSDAGNLSNSSPGQQCMADQNSLTFWQQVASLYKGDSGVWFELYNEPHDLGWSVWLNGGYVGSPCSFQTVGMQALYNAVRGAGANNIVIATGDGWGAHLDGVPMVNGTNIVYGIHPYANRSNPDAWSNNDWNNRFGYLTPNVPVVATEFGKFQCGVDTYDQGILDFFRTHGVGYTAWAWYNGGCSFPALISDAAGTCVNGGCVIQQDMLGFASGRLQMTIPGQAPTPPPAISISASPGTISSGGSATLSWSVTNAATCTASGSWSGSVATSGSRNTGALYQTATYSLTCQGDGGTSSSSATVNVNATGSAKIGDFNGDNSVNGFDLNIFFQAWKSTSKPPQDIDQNGQVNGFDLAILLAQWGP